jgi:hypothetical protein
MHGCGRLSFLGGLGSGISPAFCLKTLRFNPYTNSELQLMGREHVTRNRTEVSSQFIVSSRNSMHIPHARESLQPHPFDHTVKLFYLHSNVSSMLLCISHLGAGLKSQYRAKPNQIWYSIRSRWEPL